MAEDEHDEETQRPTTVKEKAASASPRQHAPNIQTINIWAVVVSVALAIAAIALSVNLLDATVRSEEVHERYEECSRATTELMIASDYLTTQVRMFAVTGDRRYMDAYLEELLETMRRDQAVDTLNRDIEDARAAAELTKALGESNNLAIDELYAMRLTCEALGITSMPDAVASVTLDAADEALPAAEKQEKAKNMLLGDEYRVMKEAITEGVDNCAAQLIQGIQQKEIAIEMRVDKLLFALVTIVTLLVCMIVFAAVANYVLVTRPMRRHAKSIKAEEPLVPAGALELRSVAEAYNWLYEENRKRTEDLQHEAETDALTGLLNRGSYDRLLDAGKGEFALVLVDIDLFKQINDQYGHTTGDEILKKVGATILRHFRVTDHVCRIGGDEFAIIMSGIGRNSRDIVAAKLDAIAADLVQSDDGLPKVTLSFGVAFNTDLGEDGNIYHAADKALYGAKHKGRSGYVFFGED